MALIDPNLSNKDVQPGDVIRLTEAVEVGQVDVLGRIIEHTGRILPAGTRLYVLGIDNAIWAHCYRMADFEDVINVDLENYVIEIEYRTINYPDRYKKRLL